MTSRRRVIAAVATATLGAGLLAGCQKPLPEVGVLADGTYTLAKASLYCFDGQAYTKAGACHESTPTRSHLSVRQGAEVAFEVPTEIGARGWRVRVVTASGPALGPLVKNKTYFRMSADFADRKSLSVEVIAMPQAIGQGPTSGVWEFVLDNSTGG